MYISHIGGVQMFESSLCSGTCYSMFTTNETDIVIPGYFTRHKRDLQRPWYANNWLGKRFDFQCENCEKR